MEPKSSKKITTIKEEKEYLKEQLPALAMPNTNTNNLMSELEDLLPKWKEEKKKEEKVCPVFAVFF